MHAGACNIALHVPNIGQADVECQDHLSTCTFVSLFVAIIVLCIIYAPHSGMGQKLYIRLVHHFMLSRVSCLSKALPCHYLIFFYYLRYSEQYIPMHGYTHVLYRYYITGFCLFSSVSHPNVHVHSDGQQMPTT